MADLPDGIRQEEIDFLNARFPVKSVFDQSGRTRLISELRLEFALEKADAAALFEYWINTPEARTS